MPATSVPAKSVSAAIRPTAIPVRFEGEGAGVGELTWGQREILRAVRLVGHWLPLGGVAPLPESTSLDDVLARIEFQLRRHQSLRTRLVFDGEGGVRQAVAASGELVVEHYDVPADQDARAFADALADRYSADEFDDEHDWPLRAGVVSRRGEMRFAVFIYNHLVIDGMGLSALLRDLLTMDPVTHEAPPVTALQPLELAERQRASAAARRQHELALRHWESVARAVPDRESAAADPQDPPYRHLWFRSPAGLLAVQAVAARCATDTGPVLLAASAVALGRVAGISPVALLSVVNNRFRPGLADTVMQLAQRSPCLLEVEGQSFEQVLAQAQRVSLRAGMYGYLDPDECDRMLERVARERGVPVDLSCYYNDRRAPGSQEPDSAAGAAERVGLIDDLLPQTTARWGARLGPQDNRFFLHINDSPDALDLLICADSRFLGPAGLERCAREIEAVLVRAATGASSAAVVAAAAEPGGSTAPVTGSGR